MTRHGLRLDEGNFELIGPCRVITSNMETDQFSGTYEVEFKLSGIEGNGEIGCIEVLGDAGERLIKNEKFNASADGRYEKTIKYTIGNTPKVSYGIEVRDGAKLTVDEVGWKGAYHGIELSSGVEIQPDGRIIMMTNVPDNRFSLVHFQLHSMAGEYICSFGEGYAAGNVSGKYAHDLPSGYYMLRLKGDTNRADEWVRIKVFLNEGEIIQYSYEIEELKENCIVVKNVSVNGTMIVPYIDF